MGLIAGFRAANLAGQIALVVLLFATLFNWLSFTMTDWGLTDQSPVNDDNKIGYGIWKICGNQEPDPNCQDLDGWRLAWYGTFQGFAVFGFMGVNVAFFLVILLLFVPRCLGNRDIGIIGAICAFVGTVCYVVAVILFGFKFDETYDSGFDREILQSGFYFAIITAILSLVAGICAIIGVRGGRQVASTPAGGQEQKSYEEQQRQMS